MSVLLENRPLIIFIQNYIWDHSGILSISSLVRILMMSIWPLHGCQMLFTEADIKPFTMEQQNTNMKKESSHDVKQFKDCFFCKVDQRRDI